MGVTRPQSVRCSCGERFVAHLPDSVNAARSPETRRKILDGAFNRVVCPACRRTASVEAPFLYTDLAKGVVIRVAAPQRAHRWKAISAIAEREAQRVMALLGQKATRKVRVAFGLGELREKLIAEDAGLDDRLVELMKALILYEHPFLARKPRLRIFLDRVTRDAISFVASHDHSDSAFRIDLPVEVYERLRGNRKAQRWVLESHRTNIFAPQRDHWISFQRWSSTPAALERLEAFAADITAGKEVDPQRQDFNRMLRDLPRGTHLPSWAKRALNVLQDYFHARGRDDIERQLFQIRFDFELENEWALNEDRDDIDTMWDLLKTLPDTNVEGNSYIHELLLDRGQGGGWYSPGTNDIAIGEDELINRERFNDVVLHEIAHSVHEELDHQQDQLVTRWLADRFGWQTFPASSAGVDAWVDAMGGWGPLTAAQKQDVRDTLIAALGDGSSWTPPPQVPKPAAGHPWWGADFGPRLAMEQTPADWYGTYQTWYRVGGFAFALNYWYREFMVVSEQALALIGPNGALSWSYAAMSPPEYFAELYAVHYDSNDPGAPKLPQDVRDWFNANVGVFDIDAPAPMVLMLHDEERV